MIKKQSKNNLIIDWKQNTDLLAGVILRLQCYEYDNERFYWAMEYMDNADTCRVADWKIEKLIMWVEMHNPKDAPAVIETLKRFEANVKFWKGVK